MLLAASLLVTIASCSPPRDDADADPAALGLVWVTETKDPATGFVVGGKNATAVVKNLTRINGRTIADLEADMRPGAQSDVGSDKGFLGAGESLLAVLAADNATVVEDLGLTHQELARPLRVLAAVALKRFDRDAGKSTVNYQGRRFSVTLKQWKGYQLSPFRDDTQTDTDVELVNLGTGEKLGYSLLVPDMIERYGFYEGTGTPYRVDPKQVVKVLDFLKPKKGK